MAEDEKKRTLEDRLQGVLKQKDNLVCAECPEVAPTWACFFTHPFDDGPSSRGLKVGIVCCYKCYGKLGSEICEVKSTRSARGECKLMISAKLYLHFSLVL